MRKMLLDQVVAQQKHLFFIKLSTCHSASLLKLRNKLRGFVSRQGIDIPFQSFQNFLKNKISLTKAMQNDRSSRSFFPSCIKSVKLF